MTDQADDSAGQDRPLTYHQGADCYAGVGGDRERFDELTAREMDARLTGQRARLRAEGKYDPAKHGVLRDEPLTPAEHLELIATGEVLARYFRHPTMVDHAVKAGVSWEQIGAARGATAERVRAEYREWAERQHDLWAAAGVFEGAAPGRLGMSDDEYRRALGRVAEAAAEMEAGVDIGQARSHDADRAEREAGQ